VIGTHCRIDGRPAVDAQADRIVVFGGDGTLIGVARSLGDKQIPLVGVNVGKLGFLAEFSLDELEGELGRILADDTLIKRRTMLAVNVHRNGQAEEAMAAVNDCVVQAGPPFRLIRLGLSINGEHLTDIEGDGLIVCTPSGSTAHNLSAGGPILQPGVPAIILTPLNPHSLTHKPLVVERESIIEITAHDVNEGTTAIIDGQVSCPLGGGDRVMIKRFAHDFLIVRNPRHTLWNKLVGKFHWGRAPNYD
jgi:NAD+ kinase